MALSDEERKRRNAERQREYRRTHPSYDKYHNDRQIRYMDRVKRGLAGYKLNPISKRDTKYLQSLKHGVLTHYGGGKCACVKCGEDDIDCLTIDHINNDAHHRQHGDRIAGQKLYYKLMRANYPEGYQTLCMSCNFKKSLEHLRNNGRSKIIVKDEILPLFKYFEDVALKVKDVCDSNNPSDDKDVRNRQSYPLTSDDTIKTSDDTIETSDVIYEITAF